MVERIKLTVTEVGEPKEVGDRKIPKLTFKAKNSEGQELTYFTFFRALFPHIISGAEIEAQIETTTRQHETGTYIDRKVVQLYVGGEPVINAGKGQQGGGWRGKSDAELEIEHHKNRSIEAQTALIQAVAHYTLTTATPESIVQAARVFLKFIDEAHGKQNGKPVEAKPKPEGKEPVKKAEGIPDKRQTIPPTSLDRKQFVAKVQAVNPKWDEKLIAHILGVASLDEWKETFELALEEVNKQSTTKIK